MAADSGTDERATKSQGGPMDVPVDPDRLGGIGWLERSRGHLTRADRRRLLGAILDNHARHARGLVRLVGGRRPSGHAGTILPDPPDSRLARAAEQACLVELPQALAAHSFRTWWYGCLLADRDGHACDPELFYATALLHDLGLAAAVPGEDFTLRSAARAADVMAELGVPAADIDAVRDAVSVHTLPGVQPSRDGVLGAYLQAGAMLDLVGMRACDLPAEAVRVVTERHPRVDLTRQMVAAVRAESAAMPDGRFAQISRWGFLVALRSARGVV
jgi:hypothetical protein